MPEPIHRDEPTIGDAAGEARLLRTEQLSTHRRMDAVGADEHAGGHPRAVGEPQLEAIAAVGEAGEAMAEVQTLEGQGGGQRPEQVCAMEMVVGRAEGGLHRLAERGALQGAAVIPSTLMDGHRTHASSIQRGTQAQAVQ